MKKYLALISFFWLTATAVAKADNMFVEIADGASLEDIINLISEQPMPKDKVEIIELISVKQIKEPEPDFVENTAGTAPKKAIYDAFVLLDKNTAQVERLYRENTIHINLNEEVQKTEEQNNAEEEDAKALAELAAYEVKDVDEIDFDEPETPDNQDSQDTTQE